MRVGAQFLELSYLLLGVLHLSVVTKTLLVVLVAFLFKIAIFIHSLIFRFGITIGIVIFVSLRLSLFIPNDIDVSSVDVLEGSHTSIDSVSDGSENTYDFNSVSRLHEIDQVFISAHLQSLWSLTIWDGLRGLLHFDVLFVGEHAEVVDHLEREPLIAPLTKLWLRDSSSLNEPELLSLAP